MSIIENALYKERFDSRHNSPSGHEIDEMLKVIGVASIDELIDQTIPSAIRLKGDLNLPAAKTEHEFLNDFQKLIQTNKVFDSFIGMGYYDTIVPGIIQRNILENPGWYTAYTPYQAEIAQGRLEALINFQAMIIDLTGMEIANSSLLDEGTAAAEAMGMMISTRKGAKKSSNKLFVDIRLFPQTLSVIKTRSEPFGVELIIGNIDEMDLTDDGFFGLIIQNPDSNGEVRDHTDLFASAAEHGIKCTVIADLMAMLMIKSPGEMGADIVVGSTQRFGVPKGYGGPHAAYFATKEEFKRQMPGRIIGASLDANGKNAYRMALQTREQHIRREKATSNICTAQVLLAVMAGMYTVYHGPRGLRKIATRIHSLATILDASLTKQGCTQLNQNYFDTLKIKLPENSNQEDVKAEALANGVNFRYFKTGEIGIAFGETADLEIVKKISGIFANVLSCESVIVITSETVHISEALQRPVDYMSHPVFNSYQSEHEMLRYLKRLENKDLSLVHSMISLGSCTMKLNATSEMIPITWPELGAIHPFAPADQAVGYHTMFKDLEIWLSEITGFEATSLQPNSGAQGEYTGLMVIRAYHHDRGDNHRNVTLIPYSAHGTNPASAVMAGMKVVIVQCDDHGNIDLDDMRAKAEEYKDNLAALMVTYPSTHGVFEAKIKEMCDIIHENGGQVYMDGANMNAQVGLTNPANIGADVCHLNLHKTFAIPHGGGGPGMGPICVASQLVPFLPGNPEINIGGSKAITAVSSAPWGSASVLAISYAYIAMMGFRGLTNATKLAILNANYVKDRLKGHYEILYTGENDRCAHEMIVDCRDFKQYGIEVVDIAKRLMDYGFHAPTVSFPVPGTLMIEPTESETKEELDRFCDALIQIRSEVQDVMDNKVDPLNNVLKNSPHTVNVVTSDEWDKPYSRQMAAYPLPFVMERKFWPAVSRIDDAYGDRNLVCSCLPIEAYEETEA